MALRSAAPGGLQAALDAAAPGDVVELGAGVHLQPVIVRRGGMAGRPITVRCAPGAVIRGCEPAACGVRALGLERGPFGAIIDHTPSFFRLERVDWVSFEQLMAEHVWPCLIYAKNCRHLTLARSRVWGSSFVMLVRDDLNHPVRSGHIAVIANRWVQDERIWTDYEWSDVHHGSREYLNGAFLGTVNARGPITVRDNDFRHAFNALRFDINTTTRGRPLSADARACNRDILVANNRFSFIRDNPIEPEHHASNLWIVGNEMRNCHAWFSFDGVGGRDWYVFGNRGWYDSRPRSEEREAPPHTLGRVFKFDSNYLRDNNRFHIFHNSWFLRIPLAGIGGDSWSQVREMDFANNAIGYCVPGRDAHCARVPFFQNFTWNADCRFDNDLCDHPDFPELVPGWGQERAGIRASRAIFRDPRRGDLRAPPRGEGRGRAGALAITMPDGTIWRRLAGGDIGAFQGDAVIEGPPFMAYSGA